MVTVFLTIGPLPLAISSSISSGHLCIIRSPYCIALLVLIALFWWLIIAYRPGSYIDTVVCIPTVYICLHYVTKLFVVTYISCCYTPTICVYFQQSTNQPPAVRAVTLDSQAAFVGTPKLLQRVLQLDRGTTGHDGAPGMGTAMGAAAT